jgi:plastocyanin
MKLFYGIILVLVVFVSACSQQAQISEPEAMEKGEAMEKDGDAMEGEAMKDKGSTLSAADIRILGKGGFEPSELTINAGESVTWINDDEKTFTMTIFKDGKSYMNSNVLKPGDLFEQEFSEEGTYEYWTLAYGPQGAKIVVE